MDNLEEQQNKIDQIDEQLLSLFVERMNIIGSSLPITNSSRERTRLAEISEKAGTDMSGYSRILFSLLTEMSRTYQKEKTFGPTQLSLSISKAINETPHEFPRNGLVACQGIEGAYSQIACDKLFGMPQIIYLSTFEGVFAAIDKGMCRYGVLPLENSTAGSVNRIYDLMTKYKFNIIRSVRVKIDHNLLVKKNTNMEDIKEVFSHEQAISQCSGLIKQMPGVKFTVCENTAVAARMVAESDRNDVAALASYPCAELYNLKCLERSVQDMDNNYTRFICISKNIEIYPGANRTSLMMTIPHRAGSLYQILARFYVLGMNLVKIESRPIPNRDFEFMFYFDLDAEAESKNFSILINELEELCDSFRYLGSYTET